MSQNATKPVTVRLSMRDFHILARDAERNNTSIAEMMRIAWASYQQQENINDQLRELEQRMTKRTFEIVVAVAGLDEQERTQAMNKFKRQLSGKVK